MMKLLTTPNWPEKKEIMDCCNDLGREDGWNAWRKEGYNYAIDACKKAFDEVKQNDSNVSPHKLYEMANGDTEKYKELMVVHGYLIPKAKGQELVPLEWQKIFDMLFDGTSYSVASCNDFSTEICAKYGTPKPRAGVSVNDIYAIVRAYRINGYNDMECSQKIHKLLEDGK